MACLRLRGRIYRCRLYVFAKRKEVSLKTTDPRVAEQRMSTFVAQHQTSTFPGDPRVADVISSYSEHLMVRREKKSARCDIGRLRTFFEAVPVRTLSELTPKMVHDFMIDLVARGRKPRTGNEYRIVVHGMYSFAQRYLNYRPPWPLPQNPAAMAEKFRLPAPKIVFLDKPEIEHQFAVLRENLRIQTVVAVYILAGLRRAEAMWLTHDDLTLDGHRPCILIRAKEVDGLSWQPKTAANRSVPISPTLMAMLRRYLNTMAGGGPWVFPSPMGGRWDEDNFSMSFRATQNKAGLKWNVLHFRHTFATHLVRAGVSLYQVATLMGNGPEVCRRHYASMSTEISPAMVEFMRPVDTKSEPAPYLPPLRVVGDDEPSGA